MKAEDPSTPACRQAGAPLAQDTRFLFEFSSYESGYLELFVVGLRGEPLVISRLIDGLGLLLRLLDGLTAEGAAKTAG